jgi:hypothetical protein
VQPTRVVAGGDQQGAGTLGADAEQLEQARGGRGDEPAQLTVQRLDLGAEAWWRSARVRSASLVAAVVVSR